MLNRKDFIKKGFLGFVSFFFAYLFKSGVGITFLSGCKRIRQGLFHEKILGPEQEERFAQVLKNHYLPGSHYQKVGKDFLKERPHEAKLSFLLNSIYPQTKSGDGAEGGEGGFPPVAELKGRLDQKIKNDFRKNRIIHLRGWILSESEARIAAAQYLIQNRR